MFKNKICIFYPFRRNPLLNSKCEIKDIDFQSFTYQNNGMSYIKVTGNRVSIHVAFILSGTVANHEYTVAQIPELYRPSTEIKETGWCADGLGRCYAARCRITTGGHVQFMGASEYVEGGAHFEYFL